MAKAKKKTAKTKASKKPVKAKAKTAKKSVAKKPAKKVVAKKVAKKSILSLKSKPAKTVSPQRTTKATALDIGSPCPDFSMPATQIGSVSRSALKGKSFVLYFYPKDDTSGCTAEACEFRNNISVFNRLNATIIGVSKDDIPSHEKFSRKYNLAFPLASDETGAVCDAFGTWVQKSMYGRTYMGIERSTFVVDAKGIIRAIWRKVSVPGHIEEVKKAVEALS